MSDRHDAYDLVILGSGSTAFGAALRAAALGKRAVMTENRTLGGTCVNRGCLPSKNLIAATRILWESSHPRFPGLSPAAMNVDFPALIAQKDEVVEHYRERKYGSVVGAEDRVEVVESHARLISPHEVQADGRVLQGDQILVATGSHPVVPPIEGLDRVPYLTSDLLTSGEVEELKEQPASLAIIGGGYIALELGQLFQRLGTQVTLLEQSPEILPAAEPEAARELHRLLEEEGLRIACGVRVERVEGDERRVRVYGRTGKEQRTFEAERLLVAAGRAPNTQEIGLDRAGVETDGQGFIRVDPFLRTNVPHIWAAGDVIGRHTGSQMATPVGAHDGGIVAENALNGAQVEVDHAVIPRAIFTDPELASVGLTDREAAEKGYACSCRVVPMELVPRAGAVRDTRGLIKMVIDRESRRVLGVTMLGRHASEVIHEAAMGMRFGARAEDFREMLHVYPTMSEALKLVATSFVKDVRKLSCCAD
ncbi:mercury(II) reductase [Limnochorda pilosa]|uniref:Mercuric reductase n=1 Tax=Limnochorda pilosa TaxID=1555112 RepID=A0A0K2SQV1_LIMPI|nr:mercury(II) reductase [Limnochorda pilosa]BAS29179.1 dihydrolipoamide dehydrogenase/mercuric reductase [Limnochorda pilosa]